ncbi:MAG TPA: glycosyltransferase family 87 protein [Cyclobacteriaceae bacterium]|nr:glycosyltransferase family 87 protein [Cyclobacteriaceae bacterium]
MRSFAWKLLHERKYITILWCIVVIWTFVKHNFLVDDFSNNYLIFKYTYVHAVNGENLYGHHPGEYLDKNHYGPFFSLLFAPFAILPNWAGHFFWVACLTASLYFAIRKLPLEEWQKNGIMLIVFNDLLTASFNVQFSIAVAAMIVYTFVLIWERKELWAPLPILIGAFVKLYGIVGLAFFFSVKNKWKFIAGCVLWTVVLFIAPMILSSPQYVIDMYFQWYKFLVIKNSENVDLYSYQDISIIGFVRRMLGDPTIPSLPFMLVMLVLYGLPFLKISRYKDPAYQFLLLASTLIYPILFSSSSESSTYVLVFVGIGIWFVIQPELDWKIWSLLIFAFLFGSLNTVDIYPQEFRNWLREHSIKAIPCTLIWLHILYEMMFRDLSRYKVPSLQDEHANVGHIQVKEA